MVYIQRTFMVPLRDGIQLATDLYLPDTSGRWPLILFRTPYGRQYLPENPLYGSIDHWTDHGYAVCAQDIRGTGDSQGELGLGGDKEFNDGEDVIHYLAQQDFCDGRVGMFGLSFPGFVQTAAAAQAPEELKAICPFMCPALHPFGAQRPQVLHLEHLLWTYGQLVSHPENYLPNHEIRSRLLPTLEENARHLTDFLLDLPICRCRAAAYPEIGLLNQYRASVAGIGVEEYWAQMHMPIDFTQVRAAMLFGTGWLDVAKEWTIESYCAARKATHAPVRLLIGPWAHDEHLQNKINGADHNTSTGGDIQEVRGMMLRWFDHYINGKDTAPFLQRVRYFIRGSNDWRNAAEWPPENAVLRPFYLDPNGCLCETPPTQDGKLLYTADPSNPTPSTIYDHAGDTLLADWSQVSARPDVLYFHSAVCEKPLYVAGTVHVSLFAQTDVPDTDFVCRVLDIDAEGHETELCVGMIRVSLRHGRFQREWISPNSVEQYKFTAGNLANCFLPGHRIGIQICSFLFPCCDRNLHTTARIGQGCYGVSAHHQIFTGKSWPSTVYLSVLSD